MKNRLVSELLVKMLVAGWCVYCAGGAWAGTTVDLNKCLAIGDREQRLDCYDCLARGTCQKHGTSAPASSLFSQDQTEKADAAPSAAPPHSPTARYLDELAKAEPGSDLLWSAGDTRSVISQNMEFSYITVRAGKRFGADKTPGNIMYEGQLFVNIPWQEWQLAWPSKMKYWLDIPVRIGLRQLTDNSAPVRTPSYNPGLRLYWAQGDGNPFQKANLSYYSFGIHHYSNGQDDVSTNPDGSVNTRSGSFNTNYMEAAAHVVGDIKWVPWARLAFRQHFSGTWEPFQRDQYEKHHLSLELRSREFEGGKFRYQLRMTEGVGWGYRYVVKNAVNPNLNIEAKAGDRFNTTLEFIARPLSWTDLAFYLRYDYGHDYYNINFQNRMNRLQFGFITASF